MRMVYDYSTKNFHRYCAPKNAISATEPNEVYMPRSGMPQGPVEMVEVHVQAAVGAVVVAERTNPRKAA
jgi:hypothetical protein